MELELKFPRMWTVLNSNSRKVVISATAATVTESEKPTSLPDAVQAAAAAALAAEKKEKEKQKEIRLASKSSILASKKKMSNVLTMWKQRSHEGQAPHLALDDKQNPSLEEKVNGIGSSSKGKPRIEAVTTKENTVNTSGISTSTPVQSSGPDSQEGLKPISSGGTIRGGIRGSGRGVLKSDTSYSGPSGITSTSLSTSVGAVDSSSPASIDLSGTALPFRTDASALGSYTPPLAAGSSKRRFSEMPVQPAFSQKEQNQTPYRDRAAERMSLYGSSAFGSNHYDLKTGDSDKHF